MKIIFCAYMFPDLESDLKKMKTPPSVSAHLFQKNLIRGLLENESDVEVVNVPRLRYFPHYPQIAIPETKFSAVENARGRNIPFFNLFPLNYLTQRRLLRRALEEAVERADERRVVLINYNMYWPVVQAMMDVKRKRPNVTLCGFVGDIHGKYGVINAGGLRETIRRAVIGGFTGRADSVTSQFDCFAVHTVPMAEALGVLDKPYAVIDCLFNDVTEFSPGEVAPKSVFYAGGLREDYDIEHLLRAFGMIPDSEYRLEIAGSGDAVPMVCAAAERDSRIRFLGVLPPKEVAERQRKACVLVSPRKAGHPYVPYSFPSKTVECLASGNLFVAHRLPCVSSEYDAYIRYSDDESDEALSRKIMECCEIPPEEREKIGRASREFILRRKSAKAQCARLLDMLQTL